MIFIYTLKVSGGGGGEGVQNFGNNKKKSSANCRVFDKIFPKTFPAWPFYRCNVSSQFKRAVTIFLVKTSCFDHLVTIRLVAIKRNEYQLRKKEGDNYFGLLSRHDGYRALYEVGPRERCTKLV